MSHGVKLEMSLLLALPAKFEAAIERATQKTVDQTVQIAKDHAHVITGAMQAGTYGVTHGKSGYSAAVAGATAAMPGVTILPEAAQVRPGEGVVSNATLQSVFEEYGTSNRAPHAFMGPASLEAEPLYVTNLETEVRKEIG